MTFKYPCGICVKYFLGKNENVKIFYIYIYIFIYIEFSILSDIIKQVIAPLEHVKHRFVFTVKTLN